MRPRNPIGLALKVVGGNNHSRIVERYATRRYLPWAVLLGECGGQTDSVNMLQSAEKCSSRSDDHWCMTKLADQGASQGEVLTLIHAEMVAVRVWGLRGGSLSWSETVSISIPKNVSVVAGPLVFSCAI